MEIRHLQYFNVLANELHFGRAAKRLCITQPPLSRQIKELEEELGVILFLRNNKRVELTEAGKYFLDRSQEVLQMLEAGKMATKKYADSFAGDFSLGFISTTPKWFIADLIRNLKNVYPLLSISLIEQSTLEQVGAVERGELDIGIVRGHIFSAHLQVDLLFHDQLCIVGPQGASFDLAILKDSEFISFKKAYAATYYQQSLEYCERLGFQPRVTHQCNNMNAILELVALGVGYAVCPIRFLDKRKLSILAIHSSSDICINSDVKLIYRTAEGGEVKPKIIDYLKLTAKDLFSL